MPATTSRVGLVKFIIGLSPVANGNLVKGFRNFPDRLGTVGLPPDLCGPLFHRDEHSDRVEADTPKKILETRVGVERAKFGTHRDGMERSAVIGVAAFQPGESFIFFAERYVHGGDFFG